MCVSETAPNLTGLANGQCQVRHLVQFNTFADDHPPLGDYPYGRRTRIAFNHQSHREDYYPDEDREVFSCVGCHAPEPTGRVMTVKAFDSTCASCHDENVRSSGKGGSAFLTLPRIDLRGMRDVAIDPGHWPWIEKSVAPSPLVNVLPAGDDRPSNSAPPGGARLWQQSLNLPL